MNDRRNRHAAPDQRPGLRYVSCDYRRLYPAGIGVKPADRELVDDLDRDPRACGISWVGTCFPAIWYGRGLQSTAVVNGGDQAAHLRAFYASMASRMAPASGLVRIEQATIHDSLIWTGDREQTLIYETHRYNDRPAAPLPDAGRLNYPMPFGQRPDTKYLMLGSAGSSNYGHFLVDDLPRLAGLDQLGAGRRVVLMTRYRTAIDTVRQQAVAAVCGPGVEVQWLERDTSYSVSRLYYPTPTSEHPWVKSPAAMAHAAMRCRRLVAEVGKNGRRLFVARSETGERDVVNRPALAAALAARGFETVFPEQLPFLEQVRLFASAAIIVGQMGAALTNLMFAPRGCPVLCLAPAGWIEPFYWDLAEVGGQRYSVLFGAAVGDQTAIHRRCFSIDVGKVEHWCDMTINSGDDGSAVPRWSAGR